MRPNCYTKKKNNLIRLKPDPKMSNGMGVVGGWKCSSKIFEKHPKRYAYQNLIFTGVA